MAVASVDAVAGAACTLSEATTSCVHDGGDCVFTAATASKFDMQLLPMVRHQFSLLLSRFWHALSDVWLISAHFL